MDIRTRYKVKNGEVKCEKLYVRPDTGDVRKLVINNPLRSMGRLHAALDLHDLQLLATLLNHAHSQGRTEVLTQLKCKIEALERSS